ncbi:MAG: alpha-L-arabinofuranosidase [Bacteroidaceae bacterium]|nr:alpha-L-arabinofuranosidase [Bacteroidaceae bacterium]
MKHQITTLLFAIAFAQMAVAGIPDSVYIKPIEAPNGGGMFLEWSADASFWKSVTERRILGSDYGTWGAEKRLYAPSLAKRSDGLLAAVFQVNDHVNQFAVTCTHDFVHWRPQDYPYMEGVAQCLEPVARFQGDELVVTFHDKESRYYQTRSRDLIRFSAPQPVEDRSEPEHVRIPYNMVLSLADNHKAQAARDALYGELARDNEARFANIGDLKAEVRVDATHPKPISDMLMGIFFEDINYSADGGLNAQLIQNGDFEYDPHDRMGDRNWNTTTAWQLKGEAATLISDFGGVSEHNSHAVALDVKKPGASYQNVGWDGIVVKKGEKYNFSMYLQGKVVVSLKEGNRTLASATLSGGKDGWKQVKAVLRPTVSSQSAVLDICPVKVGIAAFDMVSLIPQDTYKGHGLRRDLAETLEALHPRFMRFPGGCVTHGDGIQNIYRWKETIGPLKDRKPLRNIWGYHQSRQLGFYEFFQMCEDMQMEPLPVLAAGVPCQNSNDGGAGQQGGIPMENMPAYIQDILDLIEWANGDATTEWGRKRIEQGHKAPFNLKYLGIGNEDLISPTFSERYLMICKAVKQKYPDIQVCGTAGPFYYGSDYEEGWRIATEHKDIISLVDEHYYVSPGWYIYNQDFYDQYDRSAPKVYLGEWAAHGPGRKSTIETALSEALHFCSLERNGDVVEMSSYAPLLAKEGHTQWNPDMIYFNNTEVKPTVGYFAQRMCGQSQGNQYLASTLTVNSNKQGVRERLAVSSVRDSKTGKVYLKLVNILNHPVQAHLQLRGIIDGERTCRRTLLTGAYDSTTARPVEDTVSLSPDCQYELPAYSFTLIEL